MSDLNKQLLDAVKSNNLDLVKNLIKHGADVNIKDNKHQMTPLMYAIHFRYTDIANFLIDNNAKLDERNIDGETALMQAVYIGNSNIVKKLIERGADVNIKASNDIGVLDCLSYIIDVQTQKEIKQLLQDAQQIRQKYLNKLLNKQLFKAIKDVSITQIEKLINQGADVNAQDENGNTPLMIAVKYGYRNGGMNIIKYLVDNNANLDIQNKDGNTALIITMSNGTEESIFETTQYLVNKKANLDIQNNDGDTALIKASSNVYKDTIKYLLSHEANPNIQNKQQDFALIKSIYAIRRNNDVVKLLLEYKADVNMRNKANETLLMYASCINDADLVKYLIKYGADLDAESINAYTALSCAINGNYTNIVRILIENGVDINKKNKENYVALYYIQIIKNKYVKKEIKDLLQNAEQIRQNYLNNQLFEAVKDGNLEEVEKLISKGADINAQNSTKSTPLMIAAFLKNEQMTKFLINKGANINIQNEDGYTALFYAKYNKNENIQEQIKRKRCIEIDNFNDIIEEFSENMTDKSKVTCPLD